jgi:hypothetical protein
MGRLNTVLTEQKGIADIYRFPVGTKLYEVAPEGHPLKIVGYEYTDNADIVETYVFEDINNETRRRSATRALNLPHAVLMNTLSVSRTSLLSISDDFNRADDRTFRLVWSQVRRTSS